MPSRDAAKRRVLRMFSRDIILLIGMLVLLPFVGGGWWSAIGLCAAYLIWLQFQRPTIKRLREILSSE